MFHDKEKRDMNRGTKEMTVIVRIFPESSITNHSSGKREGDILARIDGGRKEVFKSTSSRFLLFDRGVSNAIRLRDIIECGLASDFLVAPGVRLFWVVVAHEEQPIPCLAYEDQVRATVPDVDHKNLETWTSQWRLQKGTIISDVTENNSKNVYRDPEANPGGPTFVEFFELDDDDYGLGSQNSGLFVGRWFDGNQWHDAMRKDVSFSTRHPPPDDPKETNWNIVENVTHFQQQPAEANILRIFGVEESVDRDTIRIFTQWCAAGSLEFTAKQRFDTVTLCNLLSDAWTGLFNLNTKHQMLHYDIKGANIFVDMQDGKYEGVIGDIDDVVLMQNCFPLGQNPTKTECYGAPFRHCNPKRDQVAMLLTTIETISGVNWYEFCSPKTPEGWGWSSGTDGVPLHKRWKRGIYRNYARQVRDTVLYENEMLQRKVNMLLKILLILDPKPPEEITIETLDAKWDYNQIHKNVIGILGGVHSPQWKKARHKQVIEIVGDVHERKRKKAKKTSDSDI